MPDGPSTGNIAGFIKGLIDEGVGPTEGRQLYRDAGGRVGNDAWSRLYGETYDALQRSTTAGALDLDTLPSPEQYATWSMGRGNRYATQVNLFTRDTGSNDVGKMNYTYITDAPHTPQEAIDAAWDQFFSADQLAVEGSGAGQVPLGATIQNVYQTVPYDL